MYLSKKKKKEGKMLLYLRWRIIVLINALHAYFLNLCNDGGCTIYGHVVFEARILFEFKS